MAVNVDKVYQRVLAIANKEQRGYITPQEFNLLANQAQLEIFEQYFYDINQFGRVPGNSTEYSDMLNILEEKISFFEKDHTDMSAVSGATATLPTDVYRLGTVFYNNGTNSIRVEKVTNKDIQTLSKEWLFDVIGMTDTYWQERSSKWSSNASRFGLVTSARDLLELGKFVLNGGEEGDLHVIEDIDFFDDSFRNSQNGNLAYGYLWWLNYSSTHIDVYSGELKNKNLFPDAPKDTILALGAANRILAIVPSKDLIMVRLGDFPKDSNFQNNIWLKF